MSRFVLTTLIVLFYNPVYGSLEIPTNNFSECVKKVMASVFDESSTLVFLFDKSSDLFTTNLTSNPYVTIDISKPTINTQGYVHHYILNIDRAEFLYNAIRHLRNNKIGKTHISTLRNFLIITSSKNVSKIFEYLWQQQIYNIVILEARTFNSIIHQSDPCSPQNNCGKKAVAINSYSCDFLKPITFKRTNMSGCIMWFLYTDDFYSCTLPSRKIINYFLQLFSLHLNVTVNHHRITNSTNVYTYYKLSRSGTICFLGANAPTTGYQSTDRYYTHTLVWIVPQPKEMSSVEALVHIFKFEVWIFVILSTIFTIFVWWIISSIVNKKNVVESFSNIAIQLISVSIWGIISKVPKNKTLKFIFIIYVIYVVHIQTAFTSGLIKALTMPLYDQGIEDINDLVNSKLPIYIKPYTEHYLLTDSNSSIINAIKSNLVTIKSHNNHELREIGTFRNCSGLITEQLLIKMENLSSTVHVIRDQSLLRRVDEVFKIEYTNYFLQNINNLIRTITETGIMNKLWDDTSIEVFGHRERKLAPQVSVASMSRFVLTTLIVLFYNPVYGSLEIPTNNFSECVKKVMAFVFDESSTLAYLYDKPSDWFTTNLTSNPYVTIDIRKPTINTQGYVHHYILNTDRADFVYYTIKRLKLNKIGKTHISTLRNFLIITSSKNVSKIFEYLWQETIYNVVILEARTFNSIIHQSDPCSPQNNCGKKAVAINSYSCDFLKPITFKRTNMSGCIMWFLYTDAYFSNLLPSRKTINYLLELFSLHLNVTVNHHRITNSTNVFTYYKLSRSGTICYLGANAPTTTGYQSTDRFYTHTLVWIVPQPKEMSSVEALVHIFKFEVWIFVILSTIFTIFVWWIISSIVNKKNFVESFSNIAIQLISVSIWGIISKVPKNKTLKFIFIIYVIYVVHIQTAFTSGLIKALTMPLYDQGIEDINDLVNSKLPIYIKPYTEHYLLTDRNSSIINAIKSNLVTIKSYDNHELREIGTFRNCSGLVTEQLLIKMENLSSTVHVIRDQSLLRRVDEVFEIDYASYFLQNINNLIRTTTESGLMNKLWTDTHVEIFGHGETKLAPQGAKVLTVKHLRIVFVILLVGLFLSIVIFCGELISASGAINKFCINRFFKR
ncbi:hypothetical protein RN001_011894 [Aquatica leii]|uniref:Ionotropic glutamate receptor C-terminal domain-containing protein n=1 Tax=Aquatica leii TaxID=1421715 RepID=A0AAN7P336_9COLE|nr:hypothetical protein RN001_011894 [Aquatica leii]